MKYPDYFPEDCPPSNAKFEEKTVFRRASSKKFTHNDFLSYYEQNKPFNGINGYGISVIENEKEMDMLLKAPNSRKNHNVKLIGLTNPNCGPILETPSKKYLSHITWWLYEGAEPEKNFKVADDYEQSK